MEKIERPAGAEASVSKKEVKMSKRMTTDQAVSAFEVLGLNGFGVPKKSGELCPLAHLLVEETKRWNQKIETRERLRAKLEARKAGAR